MTDRSVTVRKSVDSTLRASDFSRPGHMVPLRAQKGGILERRGHTETGVDLCTLNQPLGGVLCELVNDDVFRTMAQRDDCRAFADRWGLKMISVEMLVQYRKSRDSAMHDGSTQHAAPRHCPSSREYSRHNIYVTFHWSHATININHCVVSCGRPTNSS